MPEPLCSSGGTPVMLWDELNSNEGDWDIDVDSFLDLLRTSNSHEPNSRPAQAGHEQLDQPAVTADPALLPGDPAAVGAASAATDACYIQPSISQPHSSTLPGPGNAAAVAARSSCNTLQMPQEPQVLSSLLGAAPLNVSGTCASAAAAHLDPAAEWCHLLHTADHTNLQQQTSSLQHPPAAACAGTSELQLPQLLHPGFPAACALQPPSISSSIFGAVPSLGAAAAPAGFAAGLEFQQQLPLAPRSVSAPQLGLSSSSSAQFGRGLLPAVSLPIMRATSADTLAAAAAAAAAVEKPPKKRYKSKTMQNLVAKVAQAKARNASLKGQLQELQQEASALARHIGSMQHQISLVQATNGRLKAEVEQNQGLVAAVTKQLQERQLEKENKQQQRQKHLQLLSQLLPEILEHLAN